MNWYLAVLKKYVAFEGRAHRTEFWMFALINFLIAFGIGFVEGFIGTGGVLGALYALAVLLPALGVSVRRLHDTGRTGWWMLLVFLPIIGPIILLVFMVLDSQAEQNPYGPNPKGAAAPA